MAKVAAALFALVLVTGCGSVPPAARSASDGRTIPWLALPPNLTPPPAPSPQPAPLPEIDLQAPGTVGAGGSLEYRVTLTNDGHQPLDLVALCPTYEEEMFADIVHGSPPLGGKHIYALNCAPAGTLQPGAARAFQMIFKVPAGATPGTYTLVFNLGYWNAMTKLNQVAVKVTP